MKVNNYLVTYDDLTTMGLSPTGTPPTGNRIATKDFIITYYCVDTSHLTGYASNQCVMYQDIVALPPTSIGTGIVIAGEADCTPTTPTLTMYLDCADYTKYVDNGNCLTNDGYNTVSFIRNSDGTGMAGPFYFKFGSCSTNTFLCASDGALSIDTFQCP